MTADFRLSKWYLDCVSEEGEVFLAYRATLAWGPLTLHYGSVLGGRTTLAETPEPASSDGVLEWNSDALGVRGSWEPLDGSLEETLLEGAASWCCVAPRARARVESGGKGISGLGYVERLTLTRPPWQLSLSELRWGRFLGETDALVWIHCEGPHADHVVWHNGRRCAEEPAVVFGETRELRRGALGETILSAVPSLRKLFPTRMLAVKESKWISRASLEGREGWAIHERVLWP